MKPMPSKGSTAELLTVLPVRFMSLFFHLSVWTGWLVGWLVVF